jgi:hypothetical protein
MAFLSTFLEQQQNIGLKIIELRSRLLSLEKSIIISLIQ